MDGNGIAAEPTRRLATHRQRRMAKKTRQTPSTAAGAIETAGRVRGRRAAMLELHRRIAAGGAVEVRFINIHFQEIRSCGWNCEDDRIMAWWAGLWPAQRRHLIDLSRAIAVLERTIGDGADFDRQIGIREDEAMIGGASMGGRKPMANNQR